MPGHSKAHGTRVRFTDIHYACSHPAPFVPAVTRRFCSTVNGRGPTGEHPPKTSINSLLVTRHSMVYIPNTPLTAGSGAFI